MKLPSSIIALLERESVGLIHGKIVLELFFRDGRLRVVVKTEKSILQEDLEVKQGGQK
jgi:hypothetical protein